MAPQCLPNQTQIKPLGEGLKKTNNSRRLPALGCYVWGMTRHWFVPVLLCALAPLQGGAQSPPPLAPSTPKENPYDPKGGPTGRDPYGGYDDEAPTPERSSGDDEKEPKSELIPHGGTSPRGTGASNGRGTREALTGVLLGAAGALPGVLMMTVPCLTDECDSSTNARFIAGLAWGYAGWTLGSGLGIGLGGSLAGGEGELLAALGGAALGALVGAAGSVATLGLATALYSVNSALGLLAVVIAVPLVSLPLLFAAPIVGGMRFYESSHESAVAEQQRASASVRMLPVVSVSPSGGLVAGLVGRF